RCHSAFHITDFCRNCVIGRILKSRIKISAVLQIEQSSHLLTGVIFECSTLINRKNSWFSFFRRPAGLNAFCFHSKVAHYFPLFYYDNNILSFAKSSPLTSSNLLRRSATFSFFFSSPETSYMILPSFIITRRFP